MSWNYRVVDKGDHLALYEVYYDKDGKPNGRAESPALFYAEKEDGVEGIIATLELALDSLKRFPNVVCDREVS